MDRIKFLTSKYRRYRMHYFKVLSSPNTGGGNIDSRYFDNKLTPTHFTCKARNQNEAVKRGRKFWEDGQFGMGRFVMQRET